MKPLLCVLVAINFLFLMSCRHREKEIVVDKEQADVEDVADFTSQAINYADSVLNGMSLEQRVGQCFMPTIYTREDELTLRRLRSYISDMHVGGIVMLKGNLSSAAHFAHIAEGLDIPLFMAIDAEWGLGMRLSDAPDFPKNGNIGTAADEKLMFEYGREVARECRRVGINMVLGPVVDVAENPHGVIGSRSFGSDPVRVAELGVAYALGLEGGGVISVAKHFPGHGSPSGDSHRSLPVIKRSLNQLDSIDLFPFRKYIDAGLSGVMVGHLAVPAVDPQNLPAAVSRPVIQGLLRGNLGFEGIILTDALNMEGASGYDAVAAILAGADIVVAPADTGKEIRNVIAAVRNGTLPMEIINDRCRRILIYKYLISKGEGEISLHNLREEVNYGTDSLRRRLLR
ncbi:MAG: glycoside hydrolase family 3 protein [Muribaculaceae bacterium]|nr:glycoside hydrolase family 3 protein [Muribaculaceae bacterium]